MSVFEHQRWLIITEAQHPLKHGVGSLAYTNPAVPGVSSFQSALDYLFAVVYPKYIGTFATPAALPVTANANDYAVVTDDGDGNSAGYVWSVIDGVAGWVKRYDVDFGIDGVLAEYDNKNQYQYVMRLGQDDRDAGGTITGLYAGQHIFGGSSANTNLTLSANSGDTLGNRTGYVQVDDQFRPTINNLFDIGTATEKFKDFYMAGTANIGTMAISSGSIVDFGGNINFGSNDLITSEKLKAKKGAFSFDVKVGSYSGDTLNLVQGQITDDSGAISFDNENLSGTGSLSFGQITANQGANSLVFSAGAATESTIISSLGQINFGSSNLVTTGSITGGSVSFLTGDFGNLHLAVNTISSTNVNGDIILSPNGLGIISALKAISGTSASFSGDVVATGFVTGGNLRLTGNSLISTNTDGDIQLDPNGIGIVKVYSNFYPDSDNTKDIGANVLRFKDLYLSGSISDGTNAMSMATLISFRDANVGATAGMSLFYDGTKWLASSPDTEITHSGLSGLTTGDAGHTQFVMLTGRAGGQIIQGGTAAAENLVLESTFHASKGSVLTKDHFKPFTNATYSSGWVGTDVGGTANYFRDIYTKGEFKGFRFENYTFATLPANSPNNLGRAVYTTDTKKILVDDGSSWLPAGVGKFQSDTSWDGVIVTLDVNVSASIQDARTAIWALHDNSNDFDRIYCSIKTISATTVRITVGSPLPAGSYRLIGLE